MAVLIFVSLVNLHTDSFIYVFHLQSPCRSIRAVVLNEVSVRIPPSVQQVVFRMPRKIYDAFHLQTHLKRTRLNTSVTTCPRLPAVVLQTTL